MVRDGHPNDALVLFQLGGFAATSKPTRAARRAEDSRLPTVTAWLSLSSVMAYALMGGPDEATRYLAEAHDRWEPRDAYERAGAACATAGIHLDLAQLEAAEPLATSALRT